MKLYIDFISGDEILTDSQPIEVIDDVVFKVEGKFINPDNDNYGFSDDDDAGNGGEEVIDLVDAMNLAPFSFDKKSFMTWAKSYMKAVKARLEEVDKERVPIFMKNIQVFLKKVMKEFKEYEFFLGQSMDTNGTVVLMKYGPDGMTPYLYYFKDGLEVTKV